jgi:putative ABC transport system permease protein
MTPPGSWPHWLGALARNIVRGGRRDAELRADIDSYVDLLTEEKIAAGMPADAARRAALLELGGVQAVTEETRGVRAGALLAQCWQDAAHAVRMMRREKGFSAVAIVTLALGIGANTAMFSVFNTVLLNPLPYSQPERLVLAWERNAAIGKERDMVAALNYQEWRAHTSAFEDLGAYRFRSAVLGGVPDPEQLTALSVSASVFGALRASPQIGRRFTEEEERQRGRVVVLTHAFWQRRFGGDPSAIGRSITLNDAAFTVVGVMPPRFAFPDGDPVDVYMPLAFAPDELVGRRSHQLMVIGRVRADTSIEHARADLATIARRIAAADPGSNPDVTVVRAHDALVEDVRLGLTILLGTVGFVLLIACANVANLLLVRASSRRREIVMRTALGATRWRLIRQLLTESVVLAAMGGVVGTFMAWGLLAAIVRFPPPNIPRVDQLGIDATVLLFVAAAAIATGLIFGVMPALHAVAPRLNDAMKGTSASAPAPRRARSALVVAEVAISLVLMAAAGLMIRSLSKVHQLDLGFRSEHVFTAQVLLGPARYPLDRRQFRALERGTSVPDAKPYVFFAQVEESLRRTPGIDAIGAVSALPLNPVGTDYDLPIVIEGRPRPRPGEEPQADFRTATMGYFRAMRIPLLRGREFNEFDGPSSTPVVIVNDALSRQMFPAGDALGQRLLLYGRPREIVGVVGAVRHRGFAGEPRPEMILPYRQFQFGAMTLAVRSRLDATAVGAAVTRAVHAVDATQPVYRLRPMDDFMSDSVAQPRFTTWFLGAFAGVALLLALVGVYGVTAYAVKQRAGEIAVRMALGARRFDVVRLVAHQSVGWAAIGVIVGILGAAAGTRLMAGLLFDVTATDPLTFITAAGALGLTALAASYLPAFRAARVAPATALRTD